MEEDKGALYALTNLSGDCTEFAALFAALCRAAGIPARLMGGYICQRNCLVTTVDFHNWAEFYHNGAWHLADPQNRLFDQNGENYIATEIYSKFKFYSKIYSKIYPEDDKNSPEGKQNPPEGNQNLPGDNQNPIGEYHRYRFQADEGLRFKVKMTD